jgi:hypothetical protein
VPCINKYFHRLLSNHDSYLQGERGLATLLFVTIVVPLMFVMLTVTIELAHFFGIREELQQVLDHEAHQALVRGSSEEEVVRAVQARTRSIAGLAQLISVRHFRASARSILRARAEYSGAFFQFVQGLTGQVETVLPMELESQVRIQTAAALIVLDRVIAPAANPCSDPGLQALGDFVERLRQMWTSTAQATVAVGVTPGVSMLAPGVIAPIELLTGDGSDAIPRCRILSEENSLGVSVVRGSSGMPADPFDLAHSLKDLAISEVFMRASEVRTIVLVLRRERYDQGYGHSVFNVLQESSRNLPFPIDTYFLILDDTQTIDSKPLSVGINGGAYRELGASLSEFSGVRLLGAVSQVISGRIVLER